MSSHKSFDEVRDPSIKAAHNHVEEAPAVIEIDGFRVLGLDPQDAEFYNNYSEEKRKATIHKVDIRLVPMLALLYLICHIDRANIGNAKVEGMVEDLNLTGVQYNTILSIFFVPYVLLEVPSNLLLKKFKRPSMYLGILGTGWGIVMTCTGLVRNYGSLMAVRVLLGIFEAGFFPAAIYLCSYWYMPKDLATRISYFYIASALSGAFSGLLAAGIAEMDGVGGYEGWRWIFILEGLATLLIGISCFFFLIDSPALSTRWLEPDEIRYLELSMFIKQGGKFQDEKRLRWQDLKMALSNWRIYLQAYFLFVQSALSYGTKFTLPTITQAMGFTNTAAQLTSAPPYVAGAISALFFAKISDRYFWRMPFVALPMIIVIISYAIFLGLDGALSTQRGAAYFAAMLTCIGIYPIQAQAASWNANNVAPEGRRAIAIALNNCVGNIGGILGSFMYIDSEKPKYHTGFGLGLALGATGLIMCFVLEWTYKMGNAKKEKHSVEEVRSRYTEEQLRDMGDTSPLFKYVL